MTEERLELGARILRPIPRPHRSSRVALCWSFALLEGAAATLTMFVPAFVYHMVIMHSEAEHLTLYGVCSVLIGMIYGSFAGASAARYLERPPQPQSLVADAAFGWTAAVALMLFGCFMLGYAGDLSRISFTAAYVLGLPLLIALRCVAYAGVTSSIREGRLQYVRVAVAGTRADIARYLADGDLRRHGYALADSFMTDDLRQPDGRIQPGAILDFGRRALSRGAETLVLVGHLDDFAGIEAAVAELRRLAINVVCAPKPESGTLKFLDVVPLGANNAVRVLRKPMGEGAVFLKRAFDLLGAGIGLLLLSPLLLVVSLLIKIDSRGPVFYRQERRGFNGESFYIWKFRSMSVTESGRQMTQAKRGDPRITRMGRIMRPLNIDELPQLINVLLGSMSLVGPRPHAIQHDDELGHVIASYAHRQRIKPGITGWAQVNGYRGETSTMEQIEGRTRHDLAYIDNWSILFDFWIVLLTVFSPKARHNAV